VGRGVPGPHHPTSGLGERRKLFQRGPGKWILLARDSMLSALYAIARTSVRLSVCPSVRLSVTRVDQLKTVERIIEILSPSDRPNNLFFRHQKSLRKSDGFTPNGGAKYKGVSKN